MAVAGAFVVIFVLSTLFHLVVAADWMNTSFADVARPGGALMMVIVAYYLVLSFMMACLYPKGYEGRGPVAEGLRFGLAVGVLVYISEALHQFAVMDVTLGPALAHGGWHVVETMAGGSLSGGSTVRSHDLREREAVGWDAGLPPCEDAPARIERLSTEPKRGTSVTIE